MFTKINNWCKANMLLLSFEKTSFMQFLTKNTSNMNINIGFYTPIPNTTGLEQGMEISAIKITLLSAPIIIICIYRSPNGNFALFF